MSEAPRDADPSSREIPFGRPMITDAEREAVARVLAGHVLTHGPHVQEFEEAFRTFTGAPHAIATASCTASLHLAYFVEGIGPGDEVLVPAQTHVATAHAVELVGATPVFVDADPETGNLDLDELESKIGPKTRAISVVHYRGVPVDMPRIVGLARPKRLLVVEDCALSLGAKIGGVHTGLFGDVGCFSFYPIKHITTGEGGMSITTRADLAQATSTQRAFGIDRNVVHERKVPGEYDVQRLGLNYRLTEMGAAVGVEQMKRFPEFLAARRKNHEALAKGLRELPEIDLLEDGPPGSESSYYCMVALLNDELAPKRPELVQALKARGVGTSVYYPKPVPHFSYYRQKYGFDLESFPQAARLSYQSLALPVGPHLNREDMAEIVRRLKEAIHEVRS